MFVLNFKSRVQVICLSTHFIAFKGVEQLADVVVRSVLLMS
jgi:hypothetical protein